MKQRHMTQAGLGWKPPLTGSPQQAALGQHAGADAFVAVGGAVLTGFSVLQEDVGGAVGRGARAELGEVAFPERLATHGTRRLQLRREDGYGDGAAGASVPYWGLTLQPWQQTPSDEHWAPGRSRQVEALQQGSAHS